MTIRAHLLRRAGASLGFALSMAISVLRGEETTWIYAVQATATVQASPAQIVLSWPTETSPISSYTVSRKELGAGSWTALTTLPGTAQGFTDNDVSAGRIYEYQIVQQGSFFTGYGYVAAGLEVPAVDSRGKLILVVDNTHGTTLANELRTLEEDLVGDGWTVVRRDVNRTDSPALVREIIRGEYNADRANVRAVLLFGRVPVARSGNSNVDGHGSRPMPADAFYGDMDGNWSDANGDGVFDPSSLPSDVELQVGRVDFADLPAAGSDEALLLQQYVHKTHDYRHALRRPAVRALIGDRFGDANGLAYSATAFRNFPGFVGRANISRANTADNAPLAERWITLLTARDYLWVYGGGAGGDSAIGSLGTSGQYFEARAEDLVRLRAKGTFYLLFGSWFVDWAQRDNLLRSVLAVPDYGLTSAWAGRPHLFLHAMSMGETIGYGMRASQNNSTLYSNQVNRETRGIHLALMGDPTLRLHVVAPPSALSSSSDAAGEHLRWNAASDAVAGYHVYRAISSSGPFNRVTSSPVTGISYSDGTAPAGRSTYMVRAVKLERSETGSYYNLSQGIFASVERTSAAVAPATPAPGPAPSQPSPTPAPAPVTGGSGGGGGGAPHWGVVALLAAMLGWRHWRHATRR
jgi:hypothetical protein